MVDVLHKRWMIGYVALIKAIIIFWYGSITYYQFVFYAKSLTKVKIKLSSEDNDRCWFCINIKPKLMVKNMNLTYNFNGSSFIFEMQNDCSTSKYMYLGLSYIPSHLSYGVDEMIIYVTLRTLWKMPIILWETMLDFMSFLMKVRC